MSDLDTCISTWKNRPRLSEDELCRALEFYPNAENFLCRLIADIFYWMDIHDEHCAHGPNCRAHIPLSATTTLTGGSDAEDTPPTTPSTTS